MTHRDVHRAARGDPRARSASATPSSSRTTTSGPRCRTSPTTSATRSGSRARRPPPTRRRSSSAASTSWPRPPRSSPRQDRADPRPRRRAARSPRRSPADQLREWKAQHPGAVVVSYVNTTAEVKAESDYCCTSGNAQQVIEAIPADQEILFLPDLFLGLWLEKVTGRKLQIWLGECHVHAGIRPERHRALAGATRRTPSCSSTPNAAARARRWRSRTSAPTSSRPRRWSASRSSRRSKRFLVATETGIIHRLQKEVPGKTLRAGPRRRGLPVHEDDHAREAARLAPRRQVRGHRRPDIADRARLAIERMVAIGA